MEGVRELGPFYRLGPDILGEQWTDLLVQTGRLRGQLIEQEKQISDMIDDNVYYNLLQCFLPRQCLVCEP